MQRVLKPLESKTQVDLAELRKWVAVFARQIPEKAIVLLRGPMGVGKTQLVKYLCEFYGISTETNSPSFAIHNHYKNQKISIDHLDLFRLESEEEIVSSGFWDLFEQNEGLILVEWSERLRLNEIPLNWPMYVITLEFEQDKSKRQIHVDVA